MIARLQMNIKKTLATQRLLLNVAPIHRQIAPVELYAAQISQVTGRPHSVICIPTGTAAHACGYRFASIPDAELEDYLTSGATQHRVQA